MSGDGGQRKRLGLTEVPVIVRTADDEQVLELAIVENIQREDLNPIELAMAFHRMAAELGLSHDQIGQKTGKERATITNAVRLLQLPTDIQQMIAREATVRRATPRALLKFDNERSQRELAMRCVREGWSVRQIEEFTRPNVGRSDSKKRDKPKRQPLDPNVKLRCRRWNGFSAPECASWRRPAAQGRSRSNTTQAEDLSRIYDLIIPTIK